MNFMKGSESLRSINSLVDQKGGHLIPFYLVTANENLDLNGLSNAKFIS